MNGSDFTCSNDVVRVLTELNRRRAYISAAPEGCGDNRGPTHPAPALRRADFDAGSCRIAATYPAAARRNKYSPYSFFANGSAKAMSWSRSMKPIR